MNSITIYVVKMGTPMADGTKSLVGHMYYTLKDSNGVSYSYGFAPLIHGDSFGPGKVYTTDAVNY